MNGKLKIEGMEFYAYHGCLPFEKEVGNTFLVDVELETEMQLVVKTDALADAVDYSLVYEVVRKEMVVPSKMIEHAANRVLSSLKKQFPQVIHCRIKLTKINPPINGKIKSVSVVLEY